MSLYNHAAIWHEKPSFWPRSMYCNGHVLLDGDKMSKSTGNFLMLEEACELYSTDAVRLALADAGDSLEDANFERKRADTAVVMLFVEDEFARRVCEGALLAREGKAADDKQYALRPETAPADYFVDRAFDNEMTALANETTVHYSEMRWRDGVQTGVSLLQLARDSYRDWCQRSKVPMHAGLLARYLELAALLIAPVCPHFADHVWAEMLPQIGRGDPAGLRNDSKGNNNNNNNNNKAPLWPTAGPVDAGMNRAYKFLKSTARSLRLDAAKEKKKQTHAVVYVATTYPPFKAATLAYMRDLCAANKQGQGRLVEKKDLLGKIKDDPKSPTAVFKAEAKFIMQFASFMYDYAAEIGLEALDETLPYDQKKVLDESNAYLAESIISNKTFHVEVFDLAETPDCVGPDRKKQQATPGKPSLYLHTPAS